MFGFKTEFYGKLFQSLDNNSVLMRVEADGRYRPIWCSREYTDMMEGTEEECIRYESGDDMVSIHPDDRDEVAYLFQNHIARNGSNNLTVRKTTVMGSLIWVCVHYAFLEEDGIQYAYCTYFDVTELKESQQQTMAMYQELNKELDALSNESLAALRSNLTKGVVEEVHGRDLYDVDRAGAPISDLMQVRLANMPVASDREAYLKVFDLERLQEKYYLGEGPTS
ncbi:MAG: PAS domain S-box protein, partial [Oscillospiraceae bacterium]|nr:PAS domain S-box protein [Oscillospiraceae bacterium]